MSISRISNKVSRMSPIIVESKLLNNVMNNYRKPTKIDFVSDLHIEMWDPIYKIKYPCGNIKNYPLNMDIFERSESRFLIVGGDISDDLELTIDKLSEISNFYDKVLFIDGNHEHVNKIPMNYEKKYIQDLVNEKNKTLDNKLHYLSSAPYKIGSTLIVGKCGWWDYNGWDDKTIKEDTDNYFKDWINVSEENSSSYCYNCMLNAKKDYKDLKEILEAYEDDNSVENIVVVTHTVPLEIFAKKFNMSTIGNTEICKLLSNSSKINYWLFGHNHTEYNYKLNDVHFISNPRGRPEDEDREIYNVKTIEI